MIEDIREGRKIWPCCVSCGCRLDITELSGSHNVMLQHFFGSHEDRDARGCLCPLINETVYLEGYNTTG